MKKSEQYFELVKDEWCMTANQYKPLHNDFVAFAKIYHTEQLNLQVVGIELKEEKKEFSTDAIMLVGFDKNEYVFDKDKLYRKQIIEKYIQVQ